jgi:hypothetical protein
VRVSLPRRVFDQFGPNVRIGVLVLGPYQAHRDIAANGAREQLRFLLDVANAAPEMFDIQGLDVEAVDAHVARQDVVEALDDADDAGFAGATGSYQRSSLALVEADRNVVQDFDGWARWVVEDHVVEVDLASDGRLLTGVAGRINDGDTIDGVE